MPAQGHEISYGGCVLTVLSLVHVCTDMPHVPFRDGAWPKFLHENARDVLKLGK